jgi:hypothetical protein
MSGLIAAALACGAITLAGGSVASGADYRGAATAWPTYANGTYAANYPVNYGTGAYYVARPMTAGNATEGVAYRPTAGTMYVPTRAAYANPTYFAAYGRSPVMYQPVTTAGYAPVAGGYYAPTVRYAPTTANYAPSNSYAVQPAGISSAGSEATAYFGQPTTLNYVPPRYSYRPTYAQVPVYMYRPVTAYQPVTGQPTTCLQASTCTTSMCQPQRTHFLSWLNPFTWFGHSRSGRCGTSACGAAPTTTYCGTAACGQAQPYYPVQPVVPVVPVIPAQPAVPANTIPALPRGFVPPAGTTIPPPPTAAPGTRVIVPAPADNRPSLAPGAGTFTPGAGTFVSPPAGSVTPLPGATIPVQPAPPGGSFQTAPVQPGTGFGPGSFGTGTNYAPPSDPYSAALTPAATLNAPANGASSESQPAGPAHSVFGSGFRGEASDGVIRQPGAPGLPPSVRTVPDLDEPPTPKPVNNAPQLLDPRDKTARRGTPTATNGRGFGAVRWGVVPAQWPTQQLASGQLSQRPVAPRSAHETFEASGLSHSPYASRQTKTADYDDAGWKTAAGF